VSSMNITLCTESFLSTFEVDCSLGLVLLQTAQLIVIVVFSNVHHKHCHCSFAVATLACSFGRSLMLDVVAMSDLVASHIPQVVVSVVFINVHSGQFQ